MAIGKQGKPLHLGTQIVLDLYFCDSELLNSIDFVEKSMLEAARIAKASIVQHNFHRFEPHGISGVIVIAESHFAIHTWPEHGYAAIDLFSCNKDLFIDQAIEYLEKSFIAKSKKINQFSRG
jgi:S-adenosylmethionine decarboxylase